MLQSAVEGIELAYVLYNVVEQYIESGELSLVLADWSPYFPGYHLYYPSRQHLLVAFK